MADISEKIAELQELVGSDTFPSTDRSAATAVIGALEAFAQTEFTANDMKDFMRSMKDSALDANSPAVKFVIKEATKIGAEAAAEVATAEVDENIEKLKNPPAKTAAQNAAEAVKAYIADPNKDTAKAVESRLFVLQNEINSGKGGVAKDGNGEKAIGTIQAKLKETFEEYKSAFAEEKPQSLVPEETIKKLQGLKAALGNVQPNERTRKAAERARKGDAEVDTRTPNQIVADNGIKALEAYAANPDDKKLKAEFDSARKAIDKVNGLPKYEKFAEEFEKAAKALDKEVAKSKAGSVKSDFEAAMEKYNSKSASDVEPNAGDKDKEKGDKENAPPSRPATGRGRK